MADKYDVMKQMTQGGDELPPEKPGLPPRKFKKWTFSLILKYALIIFLAANFGLFTTLMVKHSYKGPYPQAKAMLTSAKLLNSVYIFPLSKVFGYHSAPTLPFYWIRDYLYDTGVSLIPPDDAEREIWWVRIKMDEYFVLLRPSLEAYVAYKLDKPPISAKEYVKWTDDIYNHTNALTHIHQLADPEFRTKRLQYALDNTYFYLRHREAIQFRIADPGKTYKLQEHPFFNNKNEIEKIKNIVGWYYALRSYVEKYEAEGLAVNQDYIRFSEQLLNYDYALQITAHNFIKEKEFTCDMESPEYKLLQTKNALKANQFAIEQHTQYQIGSHLNTTLSKALSQTVCKLCLQSKNRSLYNEQCEQ